MAIGNTPKSTTVNPTEPLRRGTVAPTRSTGTTAPVGQSGANAVQPPAFERPADPKGLTARSAFRPGSILTRNVGGTTPAERALPGGSIPASYAHAAEHGDLADAAAARVAANHPEIFGA